MNKDKKLTEQGIMRLSKLKDKVLDVAKKTTSQVKNFTANSIASTEVGLKSLVSVGTHTSPEDITYYFLVPDINNPKNYILHSHRVIPTNIIDESKLVKKQIFQIPSSESINTLRNMIQAKVEKELHEGSDLSSFTSDTLADLANTIDESNNTLTNGLLIVGGVMCLANPITGAAIIGTSLLPNVVSGVVSSTTKRLSSTFKNISAQNQQVHAKKIINKMTPEIVVNSILAKIERATNDINYEPNSDMEDSMDSVLLTYPLLKQLFPQTDKGLFFNKTLLPENIDRYFTVLDQSTN
jgi:hypothetical protein